ncbi:hypothetical protein D3C83_76640 [compost metagenome]
MQVLVEQEFAIVVPVGQVVDDQDAASRLAKRRLPSRVEGVMVHHKPVPVAARQRLQGLQRVGALAGT